MKTKFYFAAALFLMVGVAFSSCSKEEELLNGGNTTGELDPNAQQIVLSVENEASNLTTRSGRPLYSSAADDKVEKVKLIIVSANGTGANAQNEKIAYVKDIDWTPGQGSKIVTLDKSEQLKNGNYTIYAWGYSNDSEYDFSQYTVGQDFPKYATLKFKENSNAKTGTAEEIFAGSTEGDGGISLGGDNKHLYYKGTVEITEDKQSFHETVIMNRQVAGLMVYVSNICIPVSYTGKVADLKLRVVASNVSNVLALGHFTNGASTSSKNYVVNGYADNIPTETHVLAETALTDWWPADKIEDSKNENGVLTWENWKNPLWDNHQVALQSASVFMSAFVMPFQKGQSNTLQLQLVKKNDDNSPIATWNIAHESGMEFNYGYSFCYYNNTNKDFEHVEGTQASENIYQYSIFRNQLYRVGEHPQTDRPGKPTPLPETVGQSLMLQVDNAWTAEHGMVIVPN